MKISRYKYIRIVKNTIKSIKLKIIFLKQKKIVFAKIILMI